MPKDSTGREAMIASWVEAGSQRRESPSDKHLVWESDSGDDSSQIQDRAVLDDKLPVKRTPSAASEDATVEPVAPHLFWNISGEAIVQNYILSAGSTSGNRRDRRRLGGSSEMTADKQFWIDALRGEATQGRFPSDEIRAGALPGGEGSFSGADGDVGSSWGGAENESLEDSGSTGHAHPGAGHLVAKGAGSSLAKACRDQAKEAINNPLTAALGDKWESRGKRYAKVVGLLRSGSKGEKGGRSKPSGRTPDSTKLHTVWDSGGSASPGSSLQAPGSSISPPSKRLISL